MIEADNAPNDPSTDEWSPSSAHLSLYLSFHLLYLFIWGFCWWLILMTMQRLIVLQMVIRMIPNSPMIHTYILHKMQWYIHTYYILCNAYQSMYNKQNKFLWPSSAVIVNTELTILLLQIIIRRIPNSPIIHT